jgi:hypothetical protein
MEIASGINRLLRQGIPKDVITQVLNQAKLLTHLLKMLVSTRSITAADGHLLAGEIRIIQVKFNSAATPARSQEVAYAERRQCD